MRVRGRGAAEAFAEEGGGHRWQRVPPNERRGRVHTSTITVAVLPADAPARIEVKRSDLDIRAMRSGGSGGQKVNKTSSAIRVKHVPSGLTVRRETERSWHRNRADALGELQARLEAAARERHEAGRQQDRRGQVGSGMRGDKRRTVRCQDDVVVDHPTGRTWRYRDYARGEW